MDDLLKAITQIQDGYKISIEFENVKTDSLFCPRLQLTVSAKDNTGKVRSATSWITQSVLREEINATHTVCDTILRLQKAVSNEISMHNKDYDEVPKLLDKSFGCTIEHSDGIAFLQDTDNIYLVYMGKNYDGHSGTGFGVDNLVPTAYLGHCTWASEEDMTRKFAIKEDLSPIVRSDINEN